MGGTWGVAQSVEDPTFGFGSCHDLRGCEMEPLVGLLTQQEVCLTILSLCPSPHTHSLSL